MAIHIKRAYEAPDKQDGYRVLIDRIWPRGLSKEQLQLDEWMREIAPSDELRRWFDHDPEKYEQFKKRYFSELDEKTKLVSRLLKMAEENDLTIVYGAKDTEHNNATVLKDFLKQL